MPKSAPIAPIQAPAAAPTRRSLAQVYLDSDWVVVVLASWLVPLLGFNVLALTYLHSEFFWVLPIAALLPRFFHETKDDPRRRRAFFWTAGIILAAGGTLDLAFGRWILAFGPGPYLARLGGIPVEEFIFYLLGPLAMVLVYFWADAHFLRAVSPRQRRSSLDATGLLRFSPSLLAQLLALLIGGVALKALLGGEGPWFPQYFAFLVLTAYLPLLFFWVLVRPLVNWQALSLAVLYTLLTSVIWELSLGVPLQWWSYQKTAMLGLWVAAWQQSVRVDLPIEAVTVWAVAPFACIFFFEVITALHYHPAPSLSGKLLGTPLPVPKPPTPAPYEPSPVAPARVKRRRPKAL